MWAGRSAQQEGTHGGVEESACGPDSSGPACLSAAGGLPRGGPGHTS